MDDESRRNLDRTVSCLGIVFGVWACGLTAFAALGLAMIPAERIAWEWAGAALLLPALAGLLLFVGALAPAPRLSVAAFAAAAVLCLALVASAAAAGLRAGAFVLVLGGAGPALAASSFLAWRSGRPGAGGS